MTRTSRRKIAGVTVPLSALIVLACAGYILTGHATIHIVLAALFGLVSIITGAAYLRSSRPRDVAACMHGVPAPGPCGICGSDPSVYWR